MERSELEEIMRLVDLSVVVCVCVCLSVCVSVCTNWRRNALQRAPPSYKKVSFLEFLTNVKQSMLRR